MQPQSTDGVDFDGEGEDFASFAVTVTRTDAHWHVREFDDDFDDHDYDDFDYDEYDDEHLDDGHSDHHDIDDDLRHDQHDDQHQHDDDGALDHDHHARGGRRQHVSGRRERPGG